MRRFFLLSLILFSSFLSGCSVNVPFLLSVNLPSPSEQSYYRRENYLNNLLTQGKYEELVKEYLKDLESAQNRNDRYRQVETGNNLSRVYANNLKDYSRAIEYGEMALKLTQEAEKSGWENEPDEHFFILSTKELEKRYRECQRLGTSKQFPTPLDRYGADWIPKTKIEYYRQQKSLAISYLWVAYKAVGDTKKANYYLQAMQQDQGAKEAMKMAYESVYNQLSQKIADQVVVGDVQGAKALLAEYCQLLIDDDKKRYGGNVTSPSFLDLVRYNTLANLAYSYELFQETYDYTVKALKAYEQFAEQIRQHASQAFFKSDRDRVIMQQLGGMSGTIVKMNYLAGASLNRLGRYPEAIPYLKEAYRLKVIGYGGGGYGAEDEKLQAVYELADSYEHLGNYEEAINMLSEMVNFFEGIRAKMTREAHKISFMASQYKIYSRIIELLLKENRINEALDYAERSKARALVDLLVGKSLKPKDNATATLLAKKDSLEAKFPTDETIKADGQSWERGIKVVEKEMGDVLKEIAGQDAELASLTAVNTILSPEIQCLLDEDTSLLMYYLSDTEIIIWVVTKENINVKKVSIPLWILADKVMEFRQNIVSPLAKQVGHKKATDEVSKVRFEITPSRFKHGDPFAIRAYAKNNLPLFLAIEDAFYRIGNWQGPSKEKEILEREVPAGEGKLILNYLNTMWKITPAKHQVILKTDQGDLASNILEVTIDSEGFTNIKDLGYPPLEAGIQEEREKYAKQSLYDLLIAQVKPHLIKKRIGIIAHGILHYLPFSALEEKGRYLIEDYALFSLPSATVYKFCKEKKITLGGKVLALGNPDLNDPALDIPFAQNEVIAISKIYPDSQVLLKKEATKSSFKANALTCNILHLACHGVFDADKPLDSALLLSPSVSDTGRLTVNEIFDLPLNAGLVTLSACESGMSRIRAGDEMLGLPRAFIYAGAPSVVASLWNVNDESTSILMEKFYSHLKTYPKAEALRFAQLELLKKEEYQSPYYWAAFYLTGE